MKILKAKRKKMIEGRDKPIWNDVGFTLIIGDWEGKTTYAIIDDRTDERYPCFEIQRRDASGGNTESTRAEDVPF